MKRKLKQHWPAVAVWLAHLRFCLDLVRTHRLLRDLPDVCEPDAAGSNSGVVVFNLVRSYVPVELATEVLLALKLRHIGQRVIVLYDDGVLTHHDTLNKADPSPFRAYYPLRRRLADLLLRRLAFYDDMFRPYSTYMDQAAVDITREQMTIGDGVVSGLDLSPDIQASLVRFYLSVADEAILRREPDYERAHQMFLRNAACSLVIAKAVYQHEKPKVMVSTHGIYSTWAPFSRYLKTQGVRVITFGLNGFNIDQLDWSVGETACSKSDQGYFQQLVKQVADQPQLRASILGRVRQCMDTRLSGQSNDVSRMGRSGSDHAAGYLDRVAQAAREGRKLFCLFPNVMWDNATTNKESNRVFAGPSEWLVETTRFVAGAPDMVLVIRAHPAEHSWLGVRHGVRDILRFHLGEEIFTNPGIILIPGSERMSSYRLFEFMTCGIVYNGTIGLELLYRDIPLLIGAKAAYSDMGFAYDVTSRDDYFKALANPERIGKHQRKHRELARLFMYEYFIVHGVPMRLLSAERQAGLDHRAASTDIWSDPSLDHIAAVTTGQRKHFQDNRQLNDA
ncbi:MAG: hypothetical protein ABIE70_03080 [bacterium]